jgi:hypothetical protein
LLRAVFFPRHALLVILGTGLAEAFVRPLALGLHLHKPRSSCVVDDFLLHLAELPRRRSTASKHPLFSRESHNLRKEG